MLSSALKSDFFSSLQILKPPGGVLRPTQAGPVGHPPGGTKLTCCLAWTWMSAKTGPAACPWFPTVAAQPSPYLGWLLMWGPVQGQVCPLDVAQGPVGGFCLRQHQLLFLALRPPPFSCAREPGTLSSLCERDAGPVWQLSVCTCRTAGQLCPLSGTTTGLARVGDRHSRDVKSRPLG